MDREKVIKGFECCFTDMDLSNSMPCRSCPYGSLPKKENCQKQMFADVLDLLKEQEEVEPYQKDAVWLCGYCEKEVVGWDDDIDGKENRYPFCRQCGKAVKWE